MIKLIASDLDGTLLDENKRVPQELFSLVPRLKQMGVTFVAASGRSLFTLKKNFEPIANDIAYICDNGAKVFAGGKVISECRLPDKLMLEVIDFCAGLEDVFILLCGQEGTYHLPITRPEYAGYINPYYINQVIVDDLKEVKDSIYKIAVCDLRRPASNAYPKLFSRFKGRASMPISGDVWMDVMAADVNKGEGLKALQNYFGVSKAETMAFGDYYNDVELLYNSEYSFVMKNADEEMRRHARYIADSNANNGVIKAIKKQLSLN